MLRQLKSLQDNILKTQEEVEAMTVSASAGGGAVTAVVTGRRRVASISIEPEVVDPDDVEMLQELIVAAINQGMDQIEQAAAEKMEAITGGLGLPPGLGLG
jgi:DNA-binding YbaB/EbfC family protein